MIFSDRILALLFAAIGLGYFALTLDFPAFPGQRFGPALFPRLLAGALILCSVLLFLRRPKTAWQAGFHVAADPVFRVRERIVGFLSIPLAVAFYILAAERLGFIPVAFAILLALMLLFRVGVLRALIVAVLATAGVHYFFAGLMRVPLPRGLFMQLVAGG